MLNQLRTRFLIQIDHMKGAMETEISSVVSNYLQPRGLYSPWNSLG